MLLSGCQDGRALSGCYALSTLLDCRCRLEQHELALLGHAALRSSASPPATASASRSASRRGDEASSARHSGEAR